MRSLTRATDCCSRRRAGVFRRLSVVRSSCQTRWMPVRSRWNHGAGLAWLSSLTVAFEDVRLTSLQGEDRRCCLQNRRALYPENNSMFIGDVNVREHWKVQG